MKKKNKLCSIVAEAHGNSLTIYSLPSQFPDLLDIASTAPPSSSVNGMDASIDIGLVYDNLFDPFLFLDQETTTSPMDTTFPSFSQFDVTEDGLSEASVSPTMPSSTQRITNKVRWLNFLNLKKNLALIHIII